MFITNQTNNRLNNARNEKNGEFFITEEELERELRHYLGFFKGKKVYIPNNKMTTEIAKLDAFIRFFGSNTIIKKYELEELCYSYYDEEDNFVLVRVNDLGIFKTVIDAKDDDGRLFHVYKTIDDADVVIGNSEGNQKFDNYDAIDVDCIKTIPMDYEGVMAVPVSKEQHNKEHRVQISHYLNLWQLMHGHGVVWDYEKEERYSCFWEMSTDNKVYFDGGKGFRLAAYLDDIYVDIESMSLNVTGVRLDKEDKPIEEHELDIYIRPYCPTIK